LQQIVGQVIALIEGEEPGEIAMILSHGSSFVNSSYRAALSRGKQLVLLEPGKCPVPIGMCFVGMEERTLEETLNLVFEADFLVGKQARI